ncbi:hypothetical protein BIW11_12988 [Tropilaelaps mercedesae]|uniref:Uncharacterized protein n=1 Tax=Tropilaelaps mercedesae TaxID=418985 RepID=A0A1V9X4L0_9ACAR|nr:hypothetical protein BIW11_12988 [Tropilaelaps mercedesae]
MATVAHRVKPSAGDNLKATGWRTWTNMHNQLFHYFKSLTQQLRPRARESLKHVATATRTTEEHGPFVHPPHPSAVQRTRDMSLPLHFGGGSVIVRAGVPPSATMDNNGNSSVSGPESTLRCDSVLV